MSVEPLRLYFRYAGLSLRSQLEYPASFWMLAVSHFITCGIEFVGVVALFDRFGGLRGWTLPQACLFYGIVHVAFALAEAVGRGFDVFPNLLRSGDFDRLLLRPRSTALQVAAQECQLMRVGRFAQGLGVLLWGASRVGVEWSLPNAALILLAVLGGACLFYGLFVLQATLAFWTIESLEVMNTMTYGGTETGQYPLTVYRPWFRRFFTFVVPLACMNYLPVNAVLGRLDPFGMPVLVQWAAPLAGVVFLVAALQCWKLGVRHYRSTGS